MVKTKALEVTKRKYQALHLLVSIVVILAQRPDMLVAVLQQKNT
tara:strand:- start:828 stop:959 length:132 start_codon:yes stop_codon:yes gene_type:complete